MITNRPARLKAFDYLGPRQYFLTFCTDRRRKYFVDAQRVALVRTQIERAARRQQFALIAYCFMPDHLHLLVEGENDDSDCRAFISAAKQYSGFHYNAAFRDRLWQRYGFERVLRDSEAAASVVRYIFENPVRAGLVGRVEEYPFSGSEVYSMKQILESIQLGAGWYRSG